MVVAVAPPGAQETGAEDVDRLLLALSGEMGASKAAAEVARTTGQKKADLYRRLLELRDDAG